MCRWDGGGVKGVGEMFSVNKGAGERFLSKYYLNRPGKLTEIGGLFQYHTTLAEKN